MPTTSAKQALSNEKVATRQRSPQPGPRNSGALAHPATLIQRANLDPQALSPGDVLQLQRTIGNRAVTRLLAGETTIQRGKDDSTIAPRTTRDLPTTPSIAASASRGPTRWGNHACIFLARGAPDAMQYYKIDLLYGNPGDELGSSAASSRATSGEAQEGRNGVNITIVDATAWADPETSTTWQITDDQAQAAYARADEFRTNQGKYWYSHTGIGWRGHNCSTFAEAILKAAGVNRSAGWLFSTPSELATGQKGGMETSSQYYTRTHPAPPEHT
jgi:hypothetical protein